MDSSDKEDPIKSRSTSRASNRFAPYPTTAPVESPTTPRGQIASRRHAPGPMAPVASAPPLLSNVLAMPTEELITLAPLGSPFKPASAGLEAWSEEVERASTSLRNSPPPLKPAAISIVGSVGTTIEDAGVVLESLVDINDWLEHESFTPLSASDTQRDTYCKVFNGLFKSLASSRWLDAIQTWQGGHPMEACRALDLSTLLAEPADVPIEYPEGTPSGSYRDDSIYSQTSMSATPRPRRERRRSASAAMELDPIPGPSHLRTVSEDPLEAPLNHRYGACVPQLTT